MVVEQKRIQDLEGLSAVIIETLKSLSTEQQPLSISFLSQALAKRDEVRSMLSVHDNHTLPIRQTRSLAILTEQNDRPNHSGSAKIADRDSVLRAAVEEHEKILRMDDLFRRSTATLISLVNRAVTGAALSERLVEFKRAVLNGSEIDELEESLERLKNSTTAIDLVEIAPDTAPDRPETARGKDREATCGTGDSDAQLTAGVKSLCLNVIAEFDHDLGEDYARKVLNLRKKLDAGILADCLGALEKDLLALIRAFMGKMHEERNQITDFISEIGTSLMEIEQHFVHSMTQTEERQTVHSSINTLIESHMDEVKNSAHISSTLAEFKSMVLLRLASIREALEQKRKAEEQREEALNGEMQNLQRSLNWMKKEIDQVQEKRKALEKEILIDQLTGISNRRAAKRRLKDEIHRYQRYRQFFSVLLFDIDHFKSVNDKFGHWAGDKCLKELIKRIKPMLRETDFVARWGGEEFVILFPGTDMESAAGVAERLRKAIENTRFVYNKQEIAVTVSIGVTEVRSDDANLEAIFNRADKAMYEAKKKGRNLVVSL